VGYLVTRISEGRQFVSTSVQSTLEKEVLRFMVSLQKQNHERPAKSIIYFDSAIMIIKTGRDSGL
jgi:hypothetical protein